ncbi:MAG: adenylosuccinate lyase [Actinomycetota bacterium]
MIPRYMLPEMTTVWAEETKLGHWLRIELLACEAWARLGVIPDEDLREIRDRASVPTPDEVAERERVTNHDVAAFVDLVAESVGPAGRWIHHGLTSSDLLDTTLALQLRGAADLLLGRLEVLLSLVKEKALEHRDTICAGRTHGVIAEPTTFGHKLAVWAFDLARDRERLRRAREVVAAGKVSGAVGTYAAVDPAIEEYVCAELGLSPPEAATQVIQRDRHAEFLAAIALTGATLETIALEVRHLARTEVREVQEPFGEGQKGSSAMPHKRNPILSERICGLARVLRGNLQAVLENVALWHERDISHSSVERIVLPDATLGLDYMLLLAEKIIEGMDVFPERMRENLMVGGGLAFSGQVLLALVERGLRRDEAYGIVQEAAAKAWDEGGSFRELLEMDERVTEKLSEEELAACFERRLEGLQQVFSRLEKLEVTA